MQRTLMNGSPRTLFLALFLAWALLLSEPGLTGAVMPATDISDEEISLALRQELIDDEMVASHLIDIETIDGIVTLSGSVDHLLAKDRTLKIAQSLKGVRSVINELQVTPVVRSDEEIEADILAALAADPATDAYEIAVEVQEGTATLSGTLESWAERRLAEQVVKGVKGVVDIQNNLTFDYPEQRSDAELEAEIERVLELNPYVDETYLTVDVTDAEVLLSGSVSSAEERAQAYADAWVAGVNNVDDDQVVVEWWHEDKQRDQVTVTATDEDITQALQDAFLFDPRVASFEVHAQVENGVATLTGTVDNFKAKKAAGQDARNTLGVWRVKNYLTVRPTLAITDDQILQDVQDAIRRDPLLDRHDITVSVFNKKVYLHGTVDTSLEKRQAEDVVSRVNGVVEVQNSLTVNYEWTWKSDTAIKEDVEDKFFWSLLVDGDHITVTVEEGVVTLLGTVADWTEYYAAIDNAFEAGATDVRSYLNVKSTPTVTDNPVYYDNPPTW